MDKALKQRLVGASVLIVLAVIVLPMLLSGQPESQQDTRGIEVPARPSELSFETRRFPIGEQAGSPAATAGAQSAAVPGGEQTGDAPEEIPAMTERAPESPGRQIAPNPQPPAVAVEPAAPGRYLVQVGSFSSSGNANRLAGRLREGGMPVLLDTVETSAGRLHRVRVGPFDAETGAQEAVQDIRARIPDLKDLNPRVLDLRPDESAPVTEPSDPLVRWVVQVGSFAEEGNATDLVQRLRDNGFSAFTAAVTEPGGVSYKVRIGPVIERQTAVETVARLQSELAMEGLVISVD
ncbi:MAG: hypothetical protein GWM87_09380 [Xanthomonadales bacterium]|nr:hypothetical protein [Xanthomonadales bacterium]NIX13119.1 hypothetical protein [Xanthomonadales bacterium]